MIPVLWQHDPRRPIGTVEYAANSLTVTMDGAHFMTYAELTQVFGHAALQVLERRVDAQGNMHIGKFCVLSWSRMPETAEKQSVRDQKAATPLHEIVLDDVEVSDVGVMAETSSGFSLRSCTDGNDTVTIVGNCMPDEVIAPVGKMLFKRVRVRILIEDMAE